MKPFWTIFGSGAIAVLVFDTVASIASKGLGFPYWYASIGSVLIYAAVGYFAFRHGGLIRAAGAAVPVALVDATLGLYISLQIGPGPLPTNQFPGPFIAATLVLVSILSVFCAFIGSAVARVLHGPRSENHPYIPVNVVQPSTRPSMDSPISSRQAEAVLREYDTVAVILSGSSPPMIQGIADSIGTQLYLDDEVFLDLGKGDWLGFYDWLRPAPGQIAGVRIWLDKELPRPLFKCQGVELIETNQELLIFFDQDRQFNESLSGDQEFISNQLFISAERFVLTFNSPRPV
jgi:hypothetical protein